jgi:hypothetical protein
LDRKPASLAGGNQALAALLTEICGRAGRVAALATPGLAQGTGAGTGGASNTPTGSDQNLQAQPGTADTGGTYAPGSSSGGMSGSGMSGSGMSGSGMSSGTTGAAPASREAPSSQTDNAGPKGNIGGN